MLTETLYHLTKTIPEFLDSIFVNEYVSFKVARFLNFAIKKTKARRGTGVIKFTL